MAPVFDRRLVALAVAPTRSPQLREVLDALGRSKIAAAALLEAYKEQAIRSLADVDSPSLKGLLRRVVGKIFTSSR